MKTIKNTLIIGGLIAASAVAADRASFGLGADIVARNGIILQTRLAPNIKMPVSLAYSSSSSTQNEKGDNSSSTSYFVGVAPQFIFAQNDIMDIAVGGALGFLLSGDSQSANPDADDLDASFSIGPMLSMEYYLHKSFSIGGDFAMIYSNKFEDKHDNNYGSSTLSTNSGVVFSWYFK